MKKTLLVLLFTSYAGVVLGQEKEYYLGHHGVSLQYSARLWGLQANYHYVINPKAKFMWMGKIGVLYSPYEPSYYSAGIDLAYGGKSRIVLEVGYYNATYTSQMLLAGDIGYILMGEKHLFFAATFRIFYDPDCECSRSDPFDPDLLISLGWKF